MVKVGKLSQLPPDSTLEVAVGDRYVALCNSGGTVTALDGLCPHRGGPLGHGHVAGGRVVCPWHLWEFDCKTGEYDYNPALKLRMFAVKVEGDDILIDVPEASA